MKKQVRWKCERCGDGLLAPSKPRRDDVRRYCLPCSSETGKLVERIAPALEQHRARRVEISRQKKKVERQREKARAEKKMNTPREIAKRKYSQVGEYGMPIKKETERLWKMLAKMPSTLPGARDAIRRVSTWDAPKVSLFEKGWSVDQKNPNRVFISPGAAGTAYYDHTIKVKPCVAWATLAHEIVHRAGYSGHDRDFYMALKWLAETRFRMIIDFSKITRYGYEVDWVISGQIADAVRKTFEKIEEAAS